MTMIEDFDKWMAIVRRTIARVTGLYPEELSYRWDYEGAFKARMLPETAARNALRANHIVG